MIRECEPVRDRAGLRACVVELQEFERAIEPSLPKGEEMADRYLAHMLRRCGEATGRIFVAEEAGGAVVVELPVTNRAAFRSFVLSFLDHAEVLEPADLRDDLIAWLEALA